MKYISAAFLIIITTTLANAGIMLILYGGLGFLGLKLSKKLGYAELWDPRISNKQRLLIPALVGISLGLFIILVDLIVGRFHTLGPFPHPPFPTSIVVSAAAGIGEELLFRLFFISFWVWLVCHVILKKKWQSQIFWIVTMMSALAFGAVHILPDVVLANERAWEPSTGALARGLDRVWKGFEESAARGLGRSGELPGGLGLRRRAKSLRERVESGAVDPEYAPIATAQAFAYAINEENAAGGRVVTAPTNGAAGILPGVLLEVAERVPMTREHLHRALATAGAVAMIIKTHASISGAEVGCQGEVGSATAMAAAALCEILGGDVEQVEYAAEMGTEHNLGLTCDPLKGLVQAPCIERNAMGVAKAWSAAQFLELMRELRESMATRHVDFQARRARWYALIDSDILELLRDGKTALARQRAQAIVSGT